MGRGDDPGRISEKPQREVRGTPLPRTRVNKGIKKGRGVEKPRPFTLSLLILMASRSAPH